MNTLGEVFGEGIISTKRRNVKRHIGENSNFKSRLIVFQTVFLITFLLIILQLIHLTVIKGEYYNKLSKENRIKETIFPSPRGIITDRSGEVLVRNKPGYVAKLTCGNKECYKRITHDEALKLEAENKEAIISLNVAREYTDPFAFSHILGTTGTVNQEEIGSQHCDRKLTYEDELGRSGIEKAFDCRLQGTFGKELVETDALGNPIRVLSKVDPLPGQSVVLSIDKRLQMKAMELMQGKTGAIIAHIPATGEILTLYSSPSYDIGKFAEGLSEKEYRALSEDSNKPLFDRAIGGTYPPGSIFKTIVASGALEEKVIDKDTQIEDTGIITIGAFSFSNWYFSRYGKTEGLINLKTAIQRSNDVFFYKVGELLGVTKIAKWARKFNLGGSLGIEIEGEEKGLVPDINWKNESTGEQWFLGDTYHYSIGQGNLLVTPLQIAFANGSFANSAVICKPTLLKTGVCQKLTDKLVLAQTLNTVKEGMIAACDTGGTAFPFFGYKVNDREIKVACKTGTAEFGDPKDNTHAWFTAFVPSDNPQIAITVLVEGGGEGSAVAAPIAKELFDDWFGR